MAELSYIETRLTALQAEIEQIDKVVPGLQQQLTNLSQRRLLIQGAFLELQDFMRQAPSAPEPSDCDVATEFVSPEIV